MATLQDAIDAQLADPAFARLLLRCCPQPARTADPARLCLHIHRGDQMLLHSLRGHGDAGATLGQYFNIARQQYAAARQLLDEAFPGRDDAPVVLDFACGFGRLLRFLSLDLPPDRLHASDLQPEALAFVAEAFGVPTMPSHVDPARFTPDRRFDLIWVASLFSHLPEALFHAWLARLLELLTPRGVLCFSVRDVSLLPPTRTAPESGFVYDAFSEDAALDPEAYGTAYAGEAFVRASLARAAGEGHPCMRLRRGLAQEQDLYVVAADRSRDLAPLSRFRRGPWGWVDVRRLGHDGGIELQGWAAAMDGDDGDGVSVGVRLDGREHRVGTGVERPDVAAAFDDPQLTRSGWSFRCRLPTPPRTVALEVLAHDGAGATALLYAGTLVAAPD